MRKEINRSRCRQRTIKKTKEEKLEQREKNFALAGNRTQIYCLEGNNANHYTTNAPIIKVANIMIFKGFVINHIEIKLDVYCDSVAWQFGVRLPNILLSVTFLPFWQSTTFYDFISIFSCPMPTQQCSITSLCNVCYFDEKLQLKRQ